MTPVESQTPNYDKHSANSIYNYALLLTGKSLAEAVELPEDINISKSRGKLGVWVEKYYFKHQPPNDQNPDFPEANLELKVTGVIRRKTGEFVAKERLVLTMIDYVHLPKETWPSNHFYNKCKKMLIMFYEYSSHVAEKNRRFVLKPIVYEIPEADLPIIKSDWEFIQKKVNLGQAHEISEGDTYYLGACRKGSGGEKESLRIQPFSEIRAPSRAFCFKQGYLTKLILDSQGDNSLGVSEYKTFEKATQERFSGYLGMSVEELSVKFDFQRKGKNHKNYYRELSMKILASGGSSVAEISKAGIEMKTVRLRANGKPRESMSFPSFDFMQIGQESWEESSFFEKIERKFLFVVFKLHDDGNEKLEKVGYWNMPYEDRLEAERVWSETKRRVAIDAYDLPRITESHVAHVRPKAKNANDKSLTPQGDYRTKQCFWLNSLYIEKVINSLN